MPPDIAPVRVMDLFLPTAAVIGLLTGRFYAWMVHCYVAEVPFRSLPFTCPSCGVGQTWSCLFSFVISFAGTCRCAACGKVASPRRPWVAAVSTVLSMLLAWRFGPGEAYFVYMLFGGVLIVASFIDAELYLLPDVLTLGGTVAVPFAVVWGVGLSWQQSLTGIVVGAGLFWLARRGFWMLRGIEGMGLGDVKLAGLLGGLCGVGGLAHVVFFGGLAALVAAGAGWGGNTRGKPLAARRVPFGPFLCLGALVHVLFGFELDVLERYLRAYRFLGS